MLILVANIGSTSFKFRLFDFSDDAERELASGGVDRIGGEGGVLAFAVAGEDRSREPCDCGDHGQAIEACIGALVGSAVLAGPESLDAVAFKAVLAGDCDPVALVDEELLAAMQRYVPVAQPIADEIIRCEAL